MVNQITIVILGPFISGILLDVKLRLNIYQDINCFQSILKIQPENDKNEKTKTNYVDHSACCSIQS